MTCHGNSNPAQNEDISAEGQPVTKDHMVCHLYLIPLDSLKFKVTLSPDCQRVASQK
jgi:hypothetical protein